MSTRSFTHAQLIRITLRSGRETVDAEFDVEISTYPDEPYSTGQSRGLATEVSVSLTKAKINDEWFYRDDLTSYGGFGVSQEDIEQVENEIAEDFYFEN